MNQRRLLAPLSLIALAAFSLQLAGCAATQVAISKKDLVVQTKMSDSIFLNPVEPDQQTIYVTVRNTSGDDFKVIVGDGAGGFDTVSGQTLSA